MDDISKNKELSLTESADSTSASASGQHPSLDEMITAAKTKNQRNNALRKKTSATDGGCMLDSRDEPSRIVFDIER